MCWVMPPASPSTTLAPRMWSSSVVLPWSTWPITVMTGGRGSWSLVVVGVVEQLLQFDLFLLTRLDEQDLSAHLEREQLHLLVGERHRRRDHLAVVEQEAHDIGRGAVQLRSELLGRHTTFDDDDALGNGSVRRRVGGELRLQIVLVATTTPTAGTARRAPLTARTIAATTGTARTAGTRQGRHHRERHRDDRAAATGATGRTRRVAAWTRGARATAGTTGAARRTSRAGRRRNRLAAR